MEKVQRAGVEPNGRRRGRVRTWLIAVGAVLALLAAFAYGFAVASHEVAPYRQLVEIEHWLRANRAVRSVHVALFGGPEGRFRERTPFSASQAASFEEAEIERLRAIGYVAGSEPAPATEGVTRNDLEAQPGVNLFTSGHAAEAHLVDMQGNVLHRWSLSYDEAFPEGTAPTGIDGTAFWRRVHLLPDGGLLAIFEGIGLIRIDRDSKLIWGVENGAHHDLAVSDEGEIYVLTRRAHVVPSWHEWRPILEDFVTVISFEGESLREYSLLEAFRHSDFSPLLQFASEGGDIFHTNSIIVLDGTHRDQNPVFERGHVLVSVPKLNALAVVELPGNRVTWALTGISRFQHDPRPLANGNLLLFDNSGNDGFSRVIEIDPLTSRIVWRYPRQRTDSFHSKTCGTSQRLSGGNTLITESDRGRALEVTPEGEIVWEFWNPHRAGEDGELIATLFELERLDPRELGWLREERPRS